MSTRLALALVLSLLALPAPAPARAIASARAPAAAPLVAPASAPASARGASLERALGSVRADEIRADLRFIASDDLRGRDTPSEGLRIAARFLVARLERLGFRPGARDGFLFRYPLELRRLDLARCALRLVGAGTERTLQPGRGYWFASPSEQGAHELEGAALWCGDGSEEELAGVALEGAWAVARGGEDSARTLRRRVQQKGACGLLVLEDPDAEQRERYQSILERLAEGRVGWPQGEREAGGEEPAAGAERRRTAIPTLALDAEGERALWAAAGREGEPADLALGAPLGLRVREERAQAGDGTVEVEDVCGFWPGSDPELAKQTILVSAHYDHVGARGDVIYNGADDNGSGTCGLLALAQALTVHGPLRRSVLLLWVSGEEKGLYGSRAWSDAPWLPDGAHAIADINIDMIGRNEPERLLVTPTRERGDDYNGLVRRIEALAPLEGFTRLGSADAYYERSDQAMFARLEIPVCFLFADVHEDYHQPTDTADKIDYDKTRRVVRLVLRLLDELQADELDL